MAKNHRDTDTAPGTSDDPHNKLAPSKSKIRTVTSASSIADEIKADEFISKSDLCDAGAFNLLESRERQTTYRKRTFTEIVFVLQLLEGATAGDTHAVSVESNIAREKLARAVKVHGGVGPFRLIQKEIPQEDSDPNTVYIFVPCDSATLESLAPTSEQIEL